MATRNVLLIHGWSASGAAMKPVARLLKENGFDVAPLALGAYPSLFDDVRVEDVARRMEVVVRQLQDEGALGARFHLVAHSTGALIAREWIADRYERGDPAPVDNFVMLAPANHGSPIAVHGRSVLARVMKGWGRGFQTGEELLHALELGSAYQEHLDLRDRLSRDGETDGPYAADGTRPFVLVGAQPMDVSLIFREAAWDGTVRIAGANFDPRGLSVDFTSDPISPKITPWTRRGLDDTPFAVLPDRTHLSITEPDPAASTSPHDGTARLLGALLVEAVRVDGAEAYDRFRARCEAVNDAARILAQNNIFGARLRDKILSPGDARHPERFNEHYQIVVSAVDDTPRPITDYFLWLAAPSRRELAHGVSLDAAPSAAEIQAHQDVLRDAHRNRRDPHRRVLHLDRMELTRKGGLFRTDDDRAVIAAGVTAAAPGEKVSFFSKQASRGSGFITLRARSPVGGYDAAERFLKRYTTHYLDLRAPRVADDDVFNVECC